MLQHIRIHLRQPWSRNNNKSKRRQYLPFQNQNDGLQNTDSFLCCFNLENIYQFSVKLYNWNSLSTDVFKTPSKIGEFSPFEAANVFEILLIQLQHWRKISSNLVSNKKDIPQLIYPCHKQTRFKSPGKSSQEDAYRNISVYNGPFKIHVCWHTFDIQS